MTLPRASLFFAILLTLWLVFNAAHTAQQTVRFYTPLPITDYWRVVENLPAYQTFRPGVLWKPHNEHRIVFPEMFFAADMLWAHGRMLLPLVLSSIGYTATWLLLLLPVLVERGISRMDRAVAVLLSGVIVSFESSTMVLAVPFLLQWTLTQMAVAASLFLIPGCKEKRPALYLSGVIAAATLATFSCLVGLMLWPLIVALALLLRIGGRRVAILGAAGVLNLVLYFTGYKFTHQLALWNLFIHPIYTLNFLACYISLPFGVIKAPAFAISIGLASMLLAATFFAVAWKNRLLPSKPAIVLFGYYAFTLLAAVLIAQGRMDANETGYLAARQLRYLSVPQMNWAVLVLIALWISAVTGRRALFAGCSLFFSLVFLIAFVKLDRWFAVASNVFKNEQTVTRRIENGTVDREMIVKYVYPDFDTVVTGLGRLKEGNLSIYYRPPEAAQKAMHSARFP